MNETFLVGSLFDCSDTERDIGNNIHNTLWKQTVFGCYIIQVLQEMYHFNVTFVVQKDNMNLTAEISVYNGRGVDLFARPMSLRKDVMTLAYPVHQLFDWDFGFTVFRQEAIVNYNFYSQPFTRRLWNCLYGMALFCSILLYALKRVEIRLLRGMNSWESSFWYELLMVVGAYCQHIPPIDATLCSRRAAYLSFFMFAYIVYTYYTSNLLSHLVNDKDNMDAETLLDSDLECVILEDVKYFIWNTINFQNRNNMSELYQKILKLRSVSIEEGLNAIKGNRVAIMSDYVTLGPYIHSVFKNDEICRLMKIDVVSNLKKYFFVSKSFRYKEEFKVAILKLKEFGIVEHLKKLYYYIDPECIPVLEVRTQFRQILRPLCTLVGAYVVCVLILGCEILHHRRTRLWPYVN